MFVCPQGGRGVRVPPPGGLPDWVPPRGVPDRVPRPPGGVPGPPRGVPGQVPPGGVWVRVPPGGYPVRYPPGGLGTPLGGYLDPDPPGGTRLGTPPGGCVPRPPPGGTWPGPWGGTRTPPGGRGVPVPPRGGTQLGQHREYLLHSGRYASCVHAGGLSCSYLISSVYSVLLLSISSKKILKKILWTKDAINSMSEFLTATTTVKRYLTCLDTFEYICWIGSI